MDRRKFLKLVAAGLATVSSGQAAYSAFVAPFRYEIVQQKIYLPRLGSGLHGLRAVQISDLHIGNWFTRSHLEHVMSLVAAQEADLVFITGDSHPGEDRRVRCRFIRSAGTWLLPCRLFRDGEP
jgi:predicted MPP superfamily phosphohydrolase